ncbi:MAG: LysM domain-containing protein [Anaerolineae bacterium]|nr:LysM domain-containing protein [Anaerolineae bacterium]
MKQVITSCTAVFFSLMIAGCNVATPNATPTVEVLISDTPTLVVTPSATASATPSTTPTEAIVEVPVQVASPLPSQAPDSMGATLEVPPTVSEEPFYRYTIQEGETLGYILRLQPWGYPPFDAAIIQAVVSLNDNMTNPDFLPPPGSELLIPKRTPTPIPEGIDLTLTAAAGRGESLCGNSVCVPGQEFGNHEVQEGETLVGIMELYDTTLEVLSQQNPNLGWFGCDFTNPSGGPNCNPNIRIGDNISVPLPTRTPVPTTTPSGNETATPTPTYLPARTFFPPQGALASGRGRITMGECRHFAGK